MTYRSILAKHDTGDLYVGTRICSKCNTVKDINEFNWINKKAGRTRKCKACKDKERKELLASRDFKEVQLKAFLNSLRLSYGLSSTEYFRLLEEQNYKCKICSKELVTDTGPNKPNKAQVDHCHKTGLVRGILCFNCNSAIGKLKDDIDVLKKAIEYLQADPPYVEYIPKYKTPEEISVARSKNALKQHSSDEGKLKLSQRKITNGGEKNASAKHSDELCQQAIDMYATGNYSMRQITNILGFRHMTSVQQLISGRSRSYLNREKLYDLPNYKPYEKR